MKTVLLSVSFLIISSVGMAQDKAAAKPSSVAEHVQMHEQMAKAHQQAADCLKSGKPEEECRKAFHESCQGMGCGEKCGGPGMGMHHGKGRKK